MKKTFFFSSKEMSFSLFLITGLKNFIIEQASLTRRRLVLLPAQTSKIFSNIIAEF